MIVFHIMLLLFSILAWMYAVESMEVLPERAEMTYLNPKYVYLNATANVRRYSRRSRYFINVIGTTKHTWANNITNQTPIDSGNLEISISISQLLHNEYRPSFLSKLTHKFCDLVNKEPFVGGAIRNAGVVCPLPPGYHGITNITAPTEHFPSVFPFEKGRIEIELSITNTKESMMRLGIVASFKQKP